MEIMPQRPVLESSQTSSSSTNPRVSKVTGTPSRLVRFSLERECYAVRLESVERIARVVEVTALPKAPEIVVGIVNLQGSIVPVLDVRSRFGLPKREINLTDQLLFARTAKRTVALVVDSVSGIVECQPEDITAAERIAPGLEHIQGIARLSHGMLLIHDLDKFLSLDEEKQLDGALFSGEARR
jgi:purine-binding chemotaxis protein CheW